MSDRLAPAGPRLRRLIGFLFSFEAAFILFLFAGAYKADPKLAWFPFDFTAFFFAASVALGALIISREGVYLPGLTVVALAFVFVIWVMCTDLWTPGVLYARDKLIKLATLNLWAITATAMIVANRPERAHRFVWLLLVFGTAMSLDGLVQFATGQSERGQVLSASFRLEGYINQSRLFVLAALVAFTFWLRADPLSRRGVGLLTVFAICCYALLIAGARGPILAAVPAMLLPVALGWRATGRDLLINKAVLASLVLFAVMAAVLVQLAASSMDDLPALQRFRTLFFREGDGLSAPYNPTRLQFWRETWLLWFEQPLVGHGNGSWPLLYFGVDTKRHPHNLILEVLAEYGLIGLILLAAVAAAACRQATLRRLREEPVLMCAAMLCINTFLSAMTSGDLAENRNVFAMLGLLAMRASGRASHAGTGSGPRDLSPSGRRNSDLHQAVPNAGGGELSRIIHEAWRREAPGGFSGRGRHRRRSPYGEPW